MTAYFFSELSRKGDVETSSPHFSIISNNHLSRENKFVAEEDKKIDATVYSFQDERTKAFHSKPLLKRIHTHYLRLSPFPERYYLTNKRIDLTIKSWKRIKGEKVEVFPLSRAWRRKKSHVNGWWYPYVIWQMVSFAKAACAGGRKFCFTRVTPIHFFDDTKFNYTF